MMVWKGEVEKIKRYYSRLNFIAVTSPLVDKIKE